MEIKKTTHDTNKHRLWYEEDLQFEASHLVSNRCMSYIFGGGCWSLCSGVVHVVEDSCEPRVNRQTDRYQLIIHHLCYIYSEKNRHFLTYGEYDL